MTVISHNLSAMNTRRQLGINTKNKAKSAERLSSGYKINRSTDDAAGLQISEKLRWQIRGLNKASNNIQDGISLIQVADGALNETHSVLQRMRELAVQAANDTNTEADRNAIQQEVDQLTKEVDRIANDTNFNSEIYPLKNVADSSSAIIGFNPSLTEITKTYNLSSGGSITLTGLKLDGEDHIFYNNGSIREDVTMLTGNTDFYSLAISDLHVADDNTVWYNYHFGGKNYLGINSGGNMAGIVEYVKNNIANYPDLTLIYASVDKSKLDTLQGKLWIQMGAKSGQGMLINLVDATANGIGLTNVSVMNHGNASTAIVAIDSAIEIVSGYRSTFGAQQNRLEHAKAADDNTAENTQAAESRIRDTDMAMEMLEYSKHSILEQAGQSMLAQANQNPQGILSLLQ